MVGRPFIPHAIPLKMLFVDVFLRQLYAQTDSTLEGSLIYNNCSDLRSKVRSDGWATTHIAVHRSDMGAALDDITSLFGECIPHSTRGVTEILSPKQSNQCNPSSLSGKYGLSAFPLHTDTAHWVTPCRYIVLACLEPGESGTDTVLLDMASAVLTAEEIALATFAPFVVKNGPRSFYSTILSSSREFIRLDRGCMEPTNAGGNKALALFDRERWNSQLVRISWRMGDVLILNNWRVLHGRDSIESTADRRTLMRKQIR